MGDVILNGMIKYTQSYKHIFNTEDLRNSTDRFIRFCYDIDMDDIRLIKEKKIRNVIIMWNNPTNLRYFISLDLDTLTIFMNIVGNYECSFISKNKIINLDLSYNNIGNEGIKLLCQIPTLKSLNISGNKITTEGARIISENKTITSLNISNTDIKNTGVFLLCKNKNIRELDVSSIAITNTGLSYLASNSNLKVLHVESNNIDDDGIKILSKNKSISFLDVSYNNIGEEGLVYLKDMNIINLGFSNIHLTNEGVHNLCDISLIKSLDVSYDDVDDFKFEYLVDNMKNLTNLNVSNNNIRNIRCLVQNNNLKMIDISYNIFNKWKPYEYNDCSNFDDFDDNLIDEYLIHLSEAVKHRTDMTNEKKKILSNILLKDIINHIFNKYDFVSLQINTN